MNKEREPRDRSLGPARPETALLARRSAFNFVGLAASNGLHFLLIVVLARGLGQHHAGVFFEGYAALKLLAVVAAGGLEVTVIRYVAHHRARDEHDQAAWAVRFSLVSAVVPSALLAAAVFALAPAVARAFGSDDLELVLRVMVLSLPLAVAQLVLIGATRGTGRMRAYVLIDQILDWAVRLVAVSAALALGYGLTGAAVAYAAGAIVTVAAAAVPAARLARGAARTTSPHVRDLLRFTGYQWGGIVASVGLLWIDSLLLGLWRPPADVAVYSVATRTVLLGMVFILPIGIAFQPVIGHLYALQEWGKLRTMYSFATKWATVVGCPPLLFVALFATPLTTMLYGDSYARGAWPLALLAVGQTVNAATGPCGHIATMSGRSDLVLQNSLAALVLNIVLNLLLIPPYGMIGAGVAWSVSIVVWNLIRLWQIWKVLHMHPFHGWPPRVAVAMSAFLLAAGISRLSLDLSSDLLEVLAAATVSMLVYGLALIALRIVEQEDSWLPAPLLRLARGSHR